MLNQSLLVELLTKLQLDGLRATTNHINFK